MMVTVSGMIFNVPVAAWLAILLELAAKGTVLFLACFG